MAQIAGYDDNGNPLYVQADGSISPVNPDTLPLTGGARSDEILRRTGKNVSAPMEEARRLFEQSGIQQAYPGVTFEQYLQLHGISPVEVDGQTWASQPTREHNWGLGTQTGLGEALAMAGLAFGGMAGLNGLGLLGGEALAAGASPYSLTAGGPVSFGTGASALPNALGGYSSLAGAAAGEIGAGLGGSALGGNLGGWAGTAANAANAGSQFTDLSKVLDTPEIYETPPNVDPSKPWAPGTAPPQDPGLWDRMKNIPGGQSALSKIWNGTASADDWLKVGGNLAGMFTGVLASDKQSDMLKDLAEQANAMRKPYLDASLGYLNNPQSYFGGPVAQEAMRGMGAALSKNFGNVGESPTAQTMMLQGMAPSYWNTVSQLGNIGTGGQAAATAIGLEGVKSQGNIYNVLGAGLNDLTQPKPDYAKGVLDLFKNSLV